MTLSNKPPGTLTEGSKFEETEGGEGGVSAKGMNSKLDSALTAKQVSVVESAFYAFLWTTLSKQVNDHLCYYYGTTTTFLYLFVLIYNISNVGTTLCYFSICI